MKHFLRIFSFTFGLALIYSLITSSSAGRATIANTGNTGAPTESATCSSCHSGGGYGLVSPLIQVFQLGTTTPVTSYTAGTTYDLRVTVQHSAGTPNGYGFQLTALTQGTNSPLAGYSNLATNVKQFTITTGTWAGRTYLEHNGVTANNVFNARWTAPALGTGSVSFYVAANAVDFNHNTQNDNAGNASITLPELLPLAVTSNITPVTCNGGNNGAIDITPSGGAAPYTYNWGGGITTQDRTTLAAGTYSVTITDNNGASITNNYTVTQPNPLVALATSTNILCNGGTSTVSVSGSGGTFPYTGTGSFSENAGTHTYIITDANGCTSAPISLTIAEPSPIVVSAVVTSPITCAGGFATINVSATGGTSPYTNTGSVNVVAGSHTFTVIDANGCSKTLSNFFVTQPSSLSANAILTTPIACNGGTGVVTVSATGGTAPYTNTGNVTVSAGTGSFSISDANGCSTTTPTITITEPTAIVSSVVSIVHNTGGNNGAINVDVTGGTAPYTYSWSNGATTQDISNLSAGLYTLTITDAKGCTQVMADLAVLFHVAIEQNLEDVMTIYPNPVQNELYLNMNQTFTAPFSGQIYDIEGKAIGDIFILNEKLSSIHVSHLPAGNYFMLLKMGEKTYRHNFVKK